MFHRRYIIGDNGILRENAVHNIDKKKYQNNLDKIFGKREHLNKFREKKEEECPTSQTSSSTDKKSE